MTKKNLQSILNRLPDAITAHHRATIENVYRFAANSHKRRHTIYGVSQFEDECAVAHAIAYFPLNATVTTALLHETRKSEAGKLPPALLNADSRFAIDQYHKLDPFYTEEDSIRERSAKIVKHSFKSIEKKENLSALLTLMGANLIELRHLDQIDQELQQIVAESAQQIFAPLCNRLGLWEIKAEFEEFSFQYLEREAYDVISKHIHRGEKSPWEMIEDAKRRIGEALARQNIDAEVVGRPKQIYSIYRKMKRKNISLDEIYDIRAIRIIINSDNPVDCYRALGIVHNLWEPFPEEFDDYIARPKPNGYRSLHTAVLDDDAHTMEVQIRTQEMHQHSELGVASHWSYKEGVLEGASEDDAGKIRLVRDMLFAGGDETNEHDETMSLVIEDVKDRIVVITPLGERVSLAEGSTPVDFAYRIHTGLGNTCRGAKVNGVMVKLDYKLQEEDTVEIIKDKQGSPNREWLNVYSGYTGNASTRSKIRRWFRREERNENIEQGQIMVERELRRMNIADKYSIEQISEALNMDDTDNFLAKVGFGDIKTTQISGALSLLKQKETPAPPMLVTPKRNRKKRAGIHVEGAEGMRTRLAQCCSPLPPLPIKGYITRGRGVTIHSENCKTLDNLRQEEGDRILDASWGDKRETYPVPLALDVYDEPGVLHKVTKILRDKGINISKVKFYDANGQGTIYLEIEVTDQDEFNEMVDKMKKTPLVLETRQEQWS